MTVCDSVLTVMQEKPKTDRQAVKSTQVLADHV